jgi:hypothetical protein
MVPRRGHSGDEEWSVNGMLKGMLKGMGKHIPLRALRGGWPGRISNMTDSWFWMDKEVESASTV